MSFVKIFDELNWNTERDSIYAKTETDVTTAFLKENRTLEDFKALISPAAEKHIENMAQLSHDITLRRFGNVIQMYIPMYLSNECQNICTYCGFSFNNKIERLTLNDNQILREIAIIKEMGYDHVLLVSGEAVKTVGSDYFEHAIRLIRPHFSNIMLEVQPMDLHDYERLIACGVNTVLVYQETYHKENYKQYHPKGKKSNFIYRLDTPDRLGKAGVHRIGLGVLLGLEDWRTDSFFTAQHLAYLEKTFWKTKFSISFPRLRPAVGSQHVQFPMSEKQLVQLICAYRIYNENVELSLSTREARGFRNNAIKLGITSISAGSKTEPGGYSNSNALEQFEISDDRSPQELAAIIESSGYEPVWKDWDRSLS
ncbi:MAG: 2-iminoacetate synthase ThiH [Chitinophagales bacterium]|nr:2-iminoacetate synthase ThiH [Chitinophagales bacterium]